jgi:hypothetical protein
MNLTEYVNTAPAGEFYKRPLTIFQERINSIMSELPEKDLIKDLIHLTMFKNAEKNADFLNIIEIYNLLGMETFANLLTIVNGKTIKFPTPESFKETIQIALAFYFKTFKGKEWPEIKDLFGESDEVSPIKLGIRTQQLDRFISYIKNRVADRYKKNGITIDIDNLSFNIPEENEK